MGMYSMDACIVCTVERWEVIDTLNGGAKSQQNTRKTRVIVYVLLLALLLCWSMQTLRDADSNESFRIAGAANKAVNVRRSTVRAVVVEASSWIIWSVDNEEAEDGAPSRVHILDRIKKLAAFGLDNIQKTASGHHCTEHTRVKG